MIIKIDIFLDINLRIEVGVAYDTYNNTWVVLSDGDDGANNCAMAVYNRTVEQQAYNLKSNTMCELCAYLMGALKITTYHLLVSSQLADASCFHHLHFRLYHSLHHT